MTDNQEEIRQLEQKLEGKETSMFLICLCVGEFLLAFFLDGNISSWAFFFGSWVVAFIAWKLSKVT